MLRQQIDSNAGLDGVPEKPDDMPVEVYGAAEAIVTSGTATMNLGITGLT
jgi:hypothetical protein